MDNVYNLCINQVYALVHCIKAPFDYKKAIRMLLVEITISTCEVLKLMNDDIQ